jgi:hypothetical protein
MPNNHAVKCCLLLLLLSALWALPQDAKCATSATKPVTMTIATWLDVTINQDIVMTTVVPSWFYTGSHTSIGSTPVNVMCNVPAYLWSPETITLTLASVGSYEVSATIIFFGNSQAELIGNQWRLAYPAGIHTGTTGLQVSRTQEWTAADHAGTYTGTVTLTITAQ